MRPGDISICISYKKNSQEYIVWFFFCVQFCSEAFSLGKEKKKEKESYSLHLNPETDEVHWKTALAPQQLLNRVRREKYCKS